MTTVPERDPWLEIADELQRCAKAAKTLVGQPAPRVFQFNVQPFNGNDFGGEGGDAATIKAVDAVTAALIGRAAAFEDMSSGEVFYLARERRGRIEFSIYQSLKDPVALRREAELVAKEAELERLRAEVAELRAQVPAPVPSGAVADEPKCTPACDAMQADPAKATGLDRSWHSDDCPVPVMHLVLDGAHATVCGIAHADRPAAHGRTPDHEAVTCKACLDRMPF